MVGFWNIWRNSLNVFWFRAVNILTGSLSAIAVDRFLSDVSLSQEGHHSARCKAYLTLIWLTTITFTSPLFEVYQIKTENITKICNSDFNSLPSIQVYFIFIL